MGAIKGVITALAATAAVTGLALIWEKLGLFLTSLGSVTLFGVTIPLALSAGAAMAVAAVSVVQFAANVLPAAFRS